jgi:tetratricopeptide (TPR) repeat protein
MDRFDWLELDSHAGLAHVKPDGPKSAQAPRTMPKDGPSFYRAARAMRYAGHFKTATDFYRKTVGFDDQNFAAWVELTDTLVRAGRLDEADAVSREAHENYRQVRPLYAARALVLAFQGRMDEAMPLSNVSVDGGDRSWYSRCVRGELLLRTDPAFRTDALAAFEDAADLASPPWEPALIAGWALLDAKLFVLAAGHLAEAAHWNPRAPLCWLCLGDCFRELMFYEQALFYYQRVIELEPSHDLALERQKTCAPRVFGLMRLFNRKSLQDRWQKEFDKAMQRQERLPDDY